ncbi:hypothetical protein GCM10023091_16730 [Ravibacter arvi]|uniref:Histidine kinase domain-containing protein n=1 Tax=Ravibacter arvi TaxID=2051041 RepID=A0ABP8LWQ5_9BACT
MKIKPASSRPGKFLLLLGLHFCFVLTGYGQPQDADNEWMRYRKLYEQQKISAAGYVDSIVQLNYREVTAGRYYPVAEYLEKLRFCRELIWKNKELYDKKGVYYLLLANNARVQGREGEASYFCVKADAEIANRGGKSFYSLDQQCRFYSGAQNYTKVASLYNQHAGDMALLPALYAAGKLSDKEAINSAVTLSSIAQAFSNLEKADSALACIRLAEQLDSVYKEKNIEVKPGHILIPSSLMMAKFTLNFLAYKNYNEAEKHLDSLAVFLQHWAGNEKWRGYTGFGEAILTNFRINYSIEVKDLDSAQFYLNRYKQMGNFTTAKAPGTLSMQARIFAGQGRYQSAFQNMQQAFELKKEELISLNNQTRDLLYAYTESEFNKNRLIDSEKEKRQKTTWILVISFAAVIIVLLVLQMLQRTKRKLKADIETLNRNTDITIASMEEAKHHAVKKEQERMAQQLHDDFAATIASARQQAEVLAGEVREASIKARLTQLQQQIENVYEAARGKSHEWFYELRHKQQATFSESVRFIANSALPQNKFEVEIQIDENSAADLSTGQRISLLRILQEAVTNIIKHSRANIVTVFLYKNDRQVVFEISDNGVFDKSQKGLKKGMGLSSIESRVKEMNGALEIQNDEGLVMRITLPMIK